MESVRTATRGIARHVDREAAIWVVGLTVVALGNPESDFHFTIFWPYYVWGIESPGHGLGHSISYLFRGDVYQSAQTHLLGIPAVAIIAWRVVTLQHRLHRTNRRRDTHRSRKERTSNWHE